MPSRKIIPPYLVKGDNVAIISPSYYVDKRKIDKAVEEINPKYLTGLHFHYVNDMKEVIDFSLLKEKVKHPKKLA